MTEQRVNESQFILFSVLYIYLSDTPSIKNLKGSATWNNVDTISFGDELFAQLHEGRVAAPTARPETNWCPPSFKLQSLPSSR